MKHEISFVEFGKNNLRDYTLIEGFPGMGLVGTIAAKHIVEKGGFEEIGYIDSDMFAPIVRIHEGMPVRPARIYVNKVKKIAAIVSEQVIPRQFTYAVAKKTVEWMAEKGITELVSLSGVQSSGSNREMLYGIAANEQSKKVLEKYGIEEISEGITTGITAFILMELKGAKIDAISLLANVQLSADYKAAAEVLKKLNQMFSLSLNVEPLLEEARETERMLLDQLKKLKETRDDAERFEAKTPLVT